MNNRSLFLCLPAGSMAACTASRHKLSIPENYPLFYKEEHRGTRGLMPGNTIPAMIKRVEVGANVIEVDVFDQRWKNAHCA